MKDRYCIRIYESLTSNTIILKKMITKQCGQYFVEMFSVNCYLSNASDLKYEDKK